MIVSFWNSSNHKSGVTTNAASIALFFSLRFKKKVALFENHIPNGMGLRDLLGKKRETNYLFEEPVYYEKRNTIHYLYGLLKSGFPVRNMSDSAIRLVDNKLHYFPQEDYGSHDLLDYELNKIIDRFLDLLYSKYEIVFVDLKQFHTMTTKRIIERSDLIFLNLLPEEEDVNEFFNVRHADLSKFYFVFNKCFQKDRACREQWLEEFSIDPRMISFLPYDEQFQKVCRNGKLEGYLQKNKWATTGQTAFEMIYELRRMTNFLKEKYERKKEEKYE